MIHDADTITGLLAAFPSILFLTYSVMQWEINTGQAVFNLSAWHFQDPGCGFVNGVCAKPHTRPS